MGDWVIFRIDEICQLGRGRVISTLEIFENPGIYPVYSSQTANNGEMGRISSYDFDGEYVTWTTDGANAGTVFYRNGKFNCTNVCGTLHGKGNLSMLFLAYALSSVAKDYVSYIGNPKLMNNIVAKIGVRIPSSFIEQSTIANILHTLDQVIEKTEQLTAKYERIKIGLMQDLLWRGIDENGNIRTVETHEFKNSPLGLVPNEWKVLPLKDLLSYISYGFTNPMPTTESGPYMITATNIFHGSIQYSTCRFTSQNDFDNLLTGKSKPQLGDLLITKDGTLGRLAIVDRANICINQSVAVLKARKEYVDVFFLKMLLQSQKYQKMIQDDSGGSTIKHIYITKLYKMLIAFPVSIDEQKRINDALNDIEHNINAMVMDLNKLKFLRTGLMQDLVTGKVRVDALMNQPAEIV